MAEREAFQNGSSSLNSSEMPCALLMAAAVVEREATVEAPDMEALLRTSTMIESNVLTVAESSVKALATDISLIVKLL